MRGLASEVRLEAWAWERRRLLPLLLLLLLAMASLGAAESARRRPCQVRGDVLLRGDVGMYPRPGALEEWTRPGEWTRLLLGGGGGESGKRGEEKGECGGERWEDPSRGVWPA